MNAALDQTQIDMLQRAGRSLVQVRSGRDGAGAGIIWRHDGLVLTNHHVARHGHLQVVLAGGQAFDASLVASQPESDLALLKIDAQDLPVALISDSSQVRVGQLVFALGHPWGQVGFITSGIISAIGTFETRSGERLPYLRTDATLAPGNSGGPLLNAVGGVIGINAMIIGGDQYVAIPGQLVRAFIESVLEPVQMPVPVNNQY